jgi:hypothetical protein
MLCVAVLASSVLAAGAFPLKVDIDVSTKRTNRQIGAGASGEAKIQNVNLKVKIRRSGGDIPEGKLSAELYVIGKQIHTGNYGIMDVKKGEFELLKENNYEFIYESPTYTLGRTDGNINVGGRYETYLVVVSGPDGEIIDWRSGRALRDEGVAFIRELGPKTMFDRNGNVVGELENPGEAFKAAVPAAVDPGGGDNAVSTY